MSAETSPVGPDEDAAARGVPIDPSSMAASRSKKRTHRVIHVTRRGRPRTPWPRSNGRWRGSGCGDIVELPAACGTPWSHIGGQLEMCTCSPAITRNAPRICSSRRKMSPPTRVRARRLGDLSPAPSPEATPTSRRNVGTSLPGMDEISPSRRLEGSWFQIPPALTG